MNVNWIKIDNVRLRLHHIIGYIEPVYVEQNDSSPPWMIVVSTTSGANYTFYYQTIARANEVILELERMIGEKVYTL